MVSLPRACEHCGTYLLHYGPCSCPRALLDTIRACKANLQKRLTKLDEDESAAIALLDADKTRSRSRGKMMSKIHLRPGQNVIEAFEESKRARESNLVWLRRELVDLRGAIDRVEGWIEKEFD